MLNRAARQASDTARRSLDELGLEFQARGPRTVVRFGSGGPKPVDPAWQILNTHTLDNEYDYQFSMPHESGDMTDVMIQKRNSGILEANLRTLGNRGVVQNATHVPTEHRTFNKVSTGTPYMRFSRPEELHDLVKEHLQLANKHLREPMDSPTAHFTNEMADNMNREAHIFWDEDAKTGRGPTFGGLTQNHILGTYRVLHGMQFHPSQVFPSGSAGS